MRALAWEIKARIARTARDFDEAGRCIESALAILERFEIPVTAWQVHRTAWDLYADQGDAERADRHRARAIEVTRQLADSFEQGDPLIESFLNAPPVRRILQRTASA